MKAQEYIPALVESLKIKAQRKRLVRAIVVTEQANLSIVLINDRLGIRSIIVVSSAATSIDTHFGRLAIH